jgi:hypothetical protein
MKNTQAGKVYKSPVRKLARFFEQSRDGWKAKSRVAKAKLKRLTQRVRAVEQRQQAGQGRVHALEAELAQAKARAQELEAEVERLRQQLMASSCALVPLVSFSQTLSHHRYSLGHIFLCLRLVLSAAIRLRAASRALQICLSCFQLPWSGPTYHTGRLWLLRVGYDKLTRPKVQADDWVWIVAHTIQLGAEKCLVILGLRLSALPPGGQCLSHAAVEPLALLPVQHSNSTLVCAQLESVVVQTGVPREIIADHGTDLKSGIEKFCEAHPETSTIYDIKHKTAAVLKRELQSDEAWQAFLQQVAHTQRQVQQTALAPLAPPNLRSKARDLNLDGLIRWGQRLLTFLDQPPAAADGLFDALQVEAKFGWLRQFREPLATWQELLQVLSSTESFVRREGLYAGAQLTLQAQLQPLAQSERAQHVRAELLAFVSAEQAKAKPHERLLGSSEVIESVLGKMKELEQDQARSGFTGLILGLCALVSTTTLEVIAQALATVSTETVLVWCKQHLGRSLQAKRRAAFKPREKTEQNWDGRLAPS